MDVKLLVWVTSSTWSERLFITLSHCTAFIKHNNLNCHYLWSFKWIIWLVLLTSGHFFGSEKNKMFSGNEEIYFFYFTHNQAQFLPVNRKFLVTVWVAWNLHLLIHFFQSLLMKPVLKLNLSYRANRISRIYDNNLQPVHIKIYKPQKASFRVHFPVRLLSCTRTELWGNLGKSIKAALGGLNMKLLKAAGSTDWIFKTSIKLFWGFSEV